MAKRNIEIIPKNDKWNIQYNDGTLIKEGFDSERKAIEFGREKAAKENLTLIIKDKEGRIRRVDMDGSDSFPVPGYS